MHHGPAVDVPRLTGDVIALLGGEEQRQAGDVIGARDAAGGRHAYHRRGRIALGERVLAARGRFAAARIDAAGTDRVDGDAVRRQLLGQHLREPDDPELRRRVGAATRGAALPRDRRQVDDAPAAPREHVWDHGTAHQVRPLQIHVEHEVPRLFRRLPDQAAIGAVGRGAVVADHVAAADPSERLRDEALGVGGAAHVADRRVHAAAQTLDLAGQALEALPADADLLEPLLVLVARSARRDVGGDDVRAGARERERDRAAHPAHAATSGDQHDLSVEFAHWTLLPVMRSVATPAWTWRRRR